jgi:hypothetical protein
VEVHDEGGNVVERATKDEVEQACMEENEQRFRQANDTPFMKSPLVEEFGYLGIGENARAVLAGTYVPPQGTNEFAVMLLEQLKIPDSLRQILYQHALKHHNLYKGGNTQKSGQPRAQNSCILDTLKWGCEIQ